jgi:hypothetical protein
MDKLYPTPMDNRRTTPGATLIHLAIAHPLERPPSRPSS